MLLCVTLFYLLLVTTRSLLIFTYCKQYDLSVLEVMFSDRCLYSEIAGWLVTLYDSIWHGSSCSGEVSCKFLCSVPLPF